MGTRVYVGKVPYRARDSDVEKFFKGYKCRNIILKNGFGFVEFDDYRDADDAAYELNGKELCGEKIIVEIARGMPRGRDRVGWRPPSSSSSKRGGSSSDRYVSSAGRSEFRVRVENISSRATWKELRELMEECGKVVFCEANVRAKNEGVVEYQKKEDMKSALTKLDGKEWNGRKIKLCEEKGRNRSRSKSRSRSKDRKKSRSHSGSPSPKKSSRGDRGDAKRKSTGESGDEVENKRRKRSVTPDEDRKSPSPAESGGQNGNGNGKADEEEREGSASPKESGGSDAEDD